MQTPSSTSRLVPEEAHDGTTAADLQHADVAELSAAVARLSNAVMASGSLAPGPSDGRKDMQSLAWSGLTELTSIWGSLVASLSQGTASAQPRAAGDAAADHCADALPAVPAQDGHGALPKPAALQQEPVSAPAAYPTAPIRGAVVQPQDATAGAPHLTVTAAHGQGPGSAPNAEEAPLALGLRLLRAPTAMPPPVNTRLFGERAAAALNAVCPRCQGRRAPCTSPAEEIADETRASVCSESCSLCPGSDAAQARAYAKAAVTDLPKSLCKHSGGSIDLEIHEHMKGAACYPAAMPASSDGSEEGSDLSSISAAAPLAEPQSPLSDVSSADARTLAELMSAHAITPD